VALYLAGAEARRHRREQRTHQAELVTAWLTERGPFVEGERQRQGLVILNGSQQLAYMVIATLVDVRGTAGRDFRERMGIDPGAFRAFKGELPPGRTDLEVEYPGGGMHIRWAVELVFRDAAGVTWLRETDGRLKTIAGDPLVHYGLNEPVDW
jgi:hypothetical protein